MLLLIPLGAETSQPRIPRATLALIALNVLVFLFTSPFATRKVAEQAAELERIAEYSLREGDPALQERLRAHSSALAFLERDGQWTTEIESPTTRERLSFCLEDYKKLKARHPFYRYGFVPAEAGPLRLLTHQFLHADFLHLLFNMLFLWTVGGLLELTLGPAVFVPSYLVSGIAAALAHAGAHPDSAEPAVGASGAVAGAMGMFAVLHAREPIRLALVAALALAPRIHIFALPALVFLGLWVLEQLFFASFGSAALDVAFGAHLGGFGFGLALALGFRLWLRRDR